MLHTVFLPDEAATLSFGASWTQAFSTPCVIFLHGDLGAGKTTFTRGLLRGAGFDGTVKSPTYAIVESYTLPEKTLHHFDLYRFSSPEEWLDAGLDDLFGSDTLALIEWPQQGGDFVPAPDLVFEFRHSGNGRECSVQALSETGKKGWESWQKA